MTKVTMMYMGRTFNIGANAGAGMIAEFPPNFEDEGYYACPLCLFEGAGSVEVRRSLCRSEAPAVLA